MALRHMRNMSSGEEIQTSRDTNVPVTSVRFDEAGTGNGVDGGARDRSLPGFLLSVLLPPKCCSVSLHRLIDDTSRNVIRVRS